MTTPATDPPPADFSASISRPGQGTATIHTCAAHLAQTVRVLLEGGGVPAVKAADPTRHGCKGHQEDWPRDELPAADG